MINSAQRRVLPADGGALSPYAKGVLQWSIGHAFVVGEGPGGAGGQDVGADADADADADVGADALPIFAGGHRVYGIYVNGTTGYRDNTTSGVPTGAGAEGMYMVASGTVPRSGHAAGCRSSRRTGSGPRPHTKGTSSMVHLADDVFGEEPNEYGGGISYETILLNGSFEPAAGIAALERAGIAC